MQILTNPHTHGAVGLHLDAGDWAVLVQHPAGLREGRLQRLGQLAVLDLMVLGRPDGAGDAGPQIGLAPPGLGAAQPFDGEAKVALEFVGEAQLLRLVAVGGGDQCAGLAIFDINARRRVQLGGEAGPQLLAGQRQRQQGFLAGFGFGIGGQPMPRPQTPAPMMATDGLPGGLGDMVTLPSLA